MISSDLALRRLVTHGEHRAGRLPGHPLGDGSLRSCEVIIDGQPPIVVPASEPATAVVVQIPEEVKHVKAIDVRCTNDEGRKGLSLETVATFRNAAPGRPVLLLPGK